MNPTDTNIGHFLCSFSCEPSSPYYIFLVRPRGSSLMCFMCHRTLLPIRPPIPPLVFCRAGTISRSCSLGFYGNVWRIIPCCLGLSSGCCWWFQPAQVHGRGGDNTLLARKERGRGRAVVKVGGVLSFAICSCSGSNTYRSYSLLQQL